jgi:deoxyribonuclease V
MKQIREIPHSWDLQPKEAINLQRQLSNKIIRRSCISPKSVLTVAGIDTSYRGDAACTAVVVVRLRDLQIIEHSAAVKKTNFPYVPGLLTFREGPAILEALGKLKNSPDILIFDGQGIAHPRRFGIACHIGLLVDIPSIGCAKTKLTGSYKEPHSDKGSFSYLTDRAKTVGAVVRTRKAVKPVFVSIGHRVNLRDSIKLVLQCCSKFRLPETIRQADMLSRSILHNS